MTRVIQVNIRMSVDLKSQVQAAAAANGRSFNAEMVQRLAASLAADEIRRPPQNAIVTDETEMMKWLRVEAGPLLQAQLDRIEAELTRRLDRLEKRVAFPAESPSLDIEQPRLGD